MIYPGLPDHPQAELARRQMQTGGTMLSLELAGGKEAAFRFLDALASSSSSPTTSATPRAWSPTPPPPPTSASAPEQRAALGIGDGLVRISVGLEDPDDLLADILQALWLST